MHSIFTRSAALVCAASLVAGCASETIIRSNPPGAKVFLDGAYVGQTPYTMSDTKIVGSTTSVRLEYPGMAPVQTTIHRSEEFDAVACLGGVFLLVPFLWVMGYKPEHDYELAPGYGPQPGYPPQPGQYPPPQPGQYPPPQGYPQQPAPQPGQYPPPQGYPQPAPQ